MFARLFKATTVELNRRVEFAMLSRIRFVLCRHCQLSPIGTPLLLSRGWPLFSPYEVACIGPHSCKSIFNQSHDRTWVDPSLGSLLVALEGHHILFAANLGLLRPTTSVAHFKDRLAHWLPGLLGLKPVLLLGFLFMLGG